MSDLISHADVDESIRLVSSSIILLILIDSNLLLSLAQTHASKASLQDDGPSGPREDTVASIYSLMCDLAAARGPGTRIPYSHIEAMVLKKGFTTQQLNVCIHEYDQLGVLSVDADRSHITIDN